MSIGPNTWLAIAGYASLPVAWWLHRRGQARWAVLVLALCAGLLRLSASLDPCLHEWDERYHALVAKHLVEHPLKPTLYEDAALPYNEGSWAHGHVWLNKPPLSLWAIAGSLRLFGTEPLAVRVPSILLSMIATVLLFALARERFQRNVAFIAALLFAINGHLIELASGRTSNDHPDTFLVVFVLASLFAASRMALRNSMRWSVVAGLLAGCAFLCKSWPVLIVLPVAAGFLWSNTELGWRRRAELLGALVLCAVLTALPWALYVQHEFPAVQAAAADSHWRHFSEGLEDHARPWYYFLAQLPMIHGELAPIALLWFLLFALKRSRRKYLPLAIWVSLPFVVFSFAITKMPGYTAIAAPAIFIIVALALEAWWGAAVESPWRRLGLRIIALCLLVLPLRFSFDRVQPLTRTEPAYRVETWTDQGKGTVVMRCSHPIERMFHTDVSAAYEDMLSDTTITRLRASGYRVITE